MFLLCHSLALSFGVDIVVGMFGMDGTFVVVAAAGTVVMRVRIVVGIVVDLAVVVIVVVIVVERVRVADVVVSVSITVAYVVLWLVCYSCCGGCCACFRSVLSLYQVLASLL